MLWKWKTSKLSEIKVLPLKCLLQESKYLLVNHYPRKPKKTVFILKFELN